MTSSTFIIANVDEEARARYQQYQQTRQATERELKVTPGEALDTDAAADLPPSPHRDDATARRAQALLDLHLKG